MEDVNISATTPMAVFRVLVEQVITLHLMNLLFAQTSMNVTWKMEDALMTVLIQKEIIFANVQKAINWGQIIKIANWWKKACHVVLIQDRNMGKYNYILHYTGLIYFDEKNWFPVLLIDWKCTYKIKLINNIQNLIMYLPGFWDVMREKKTD